MSSDFPSNTYYIEPFLAPRKLLTFTGSHLYFVERGDEFKTQLWEYKNGFLTNMRYPEYKLTLGNLSRFYYDGSTLASSSGMCLTYVPNTGSLSLQQPRKSSATTQMFVLIPCRDFPNSVYERHLYNAKTGQKIHIYSSFYDRILSHMNNNIMVDAKKRGNRKTHQWYFHNGKITNVESGKLLSYDIKNKAISLKDASMTPVDIISQTWRFNGLGFMSMVDGQVIQLDGNEKRSCDFRIIPVPKSVERLDQFSPRVDQISIEVSELLDRIQNDGEILLVTEVLECESSLQNLMKEILQIKRSGGNIRDLEKNIQSALTITIRWKLKKEETRRNLSKIYEEVLMNVNYQGNPLTKKEKLILEETGMKYLIRLDNFGTLSQDLRTLRKNIINHIKAFQKSLDSVKLLD